MSNPSIRPRAHEVDTQARRLVPLTLPQHWEHREFTGRDYGIDMHVELFNAGAATGALLFLQVKGTAAVIRDSSEVLFDVPVQNLRYSELFVPPVLLMVCPVNNHPPRSYFLWLQDYIQVILDHEKPNWRHNVRSVRVRIPVENCMPGGEQALAFIANYPRRLKEWGQLSRIHHELSWAYSTIDLDEVNHVSLNRVIQFFEEALKLEGIFGDPTWPWGTLMRMTVLEHGIRAARLLLRGGPFSEHDMESIGRSMNTADLPPSIDTQEIYSFTVEATLQHFIDRIGTMISIGNDDKLKRGIWESFGDHDF